MTVILLRHGQSSANTSGTLAGRTPGVGLDATGISQASAVADRLSDSGLVEIVRSPLQRCEETVAPLALRLGLEPVVEQRLIEVDYGDWTGRKLTDLTSEQIWSVVQQHPSSAVFPGGEGLASMAGRAVAAIREHDIRLADAHGKDVPWVACSHGDIIKAVIADAYGMHLDTFQRIVAEPASLSIVRYTSHRPFVLRVNDTGSELPCLNGSAVGRVSEPAGNGSDSDAVPGGPAPRNGGPNTPSGEENADGTSAS